MPDSPEAVANLRFALRQHGITDADGYIRDLVTWSAAVAMDRRRPGGASYGSGLMGALLGPRVDEVRSCFAGDTPAPFNLFIEVSADGVLADITALPPTRVGRCFGDALRTARVAAPPFAPFHAQMAMQFGG